MQPICPLTGEWIKKMQYIQLNYSAIKKNEIMPISASQMDLGIIILSEVSQTEDKYHMTSLICGISKHDTNDTKQKQIQRQEINLWLPKGIVGEWGEVNQE